MKLSIVTTLYNSSKYIEEFYSKISIEAQKIKNNYEIIFVDDGSPDDSLSKAIKLCKKDSHVKVIELSKNFGHHKAIMTGLNHARGDFVFLIDSDLEEEPELLGKFWEELNKNNIDVDAVYGAQQIRKGHLFERLSGWFFYKIFNFLSEIKIPKNFLTVRLMKKNYVRNLISFKEKQIVFSILNVLNGFKVKEILVSKKHLSKTTYNFQSKIKLVFSHITASSPKFLHLAFYVGFFITINSFFFILYLIINKFIFDTTPHGWVSILSSIFLFGGLTILFLGLIGLYIAEIFIEVKNRPITIIKNIYQENINEETV